MSDHRRVRFVQLPAARISRRDFLRRLGSAAAGAVAAGTLPACGSSPSPRVPAGGRQLEFLHGVASGDPLADRVMLWTRITPADPEHGAVAVRWRLYADPGLQTELASGQVMTDADRDYTVKVDVTGLSSWTSYYYRFEVDTADGVLHSPVGRTRTAPAADDPVDQLRIALASCQSWSFGYFNALGRIAERADLDFVLHLGDYIYEYGDANVRAHDPPHEIVTLEDYRRRYAQYRTDPDLQEAHRQHPWLHIWDDHETANNSWSGGAENHSEGADAEGFWHERVGWALRAYFEWMPVREPGACCDAPAAGQPHREPAPSGRSPAGAGRIYRKVSYGELIDLFLLDTRLVGRAEQDTSFPFDPEQTILGAEQRQWFLDALSRSTARWKIVATGTNFAPLRAGPSNPLTGCTSPPEPICWLNEDAWDGYRFDREAVYDAIEQGGVRNVVFVFGDIHAVLACDLPRDPFSPGGYDPATGAGSLAVELGCGGVANLPAPVWDQLRAVNPHIRHVNQTQLGWMLLDVRPQRLQAEWYYSPTAFVTTSESRDPVMLQVADGVPHLVAAPVPSDPRPDPPPPAPA